MNQRAVILPLVLAFGVAGAGRAHAACDDAIANKVYRCSLKRSDGEQFTDCYRFGRPGVVSEHFDLTPDVFGSALGCGCSAKGKLKNVHFDQGAEFQCVSTAFSGVGLSLRGKSKANGNKIVKGQGLNEQGLLFAFECVQDATCSVAAVQPAAAVGRYR